MNNGSIVLVVSENILKPCHPGEKLLYTSSPQAQYYECEAHWVRK